MANNYNANTECNKTDLSFAKMLPRRNMTEVVHKAGGSSFPSNNLINSVKKHWFEQVFPLEMGVEHFNAFRP